jgi:hypothetical protein
MPCHSVRDSVQIFLSAHRRKEWGLHHERARAECNTLLFAAGTAARANAAARSGRPDVFALVLRTRQCSRGAHRQHLSVGSITFFDCRQVGTSKVINA